MMGVLKNSGLALVLGALLASTLAAQSRDDLVLVSLRSGAAAIRAHDVRLSDIADVDIVTATESRRRSSRILAERVVVARFGDRPRISISQAAIRRALVAAGFVGAAVDIQGANGVEASRQMMTLNAARIRAAVRRHVRDVLGQDGADARVLGVIRPKEVPVARWRLRLVVAPRDEQTRWFGRTPVDVTVEVDGRAVSTMTVDVVVDRPVYVVRAVKRISRGRPVARDEVALEEVEAGAATAEHFTSIEEVVGLIAIDGFTRGQSISRRAVRRRPVIHKGDIVTARVTVGSLVVEATCIARMEGAPGDRIILENVESKRAVRGVVVDGKNVDVLVGR